MPNAPLRCGQIASPPLTLHSQRRILAPPQTASRSARPQPALRVESRLPGGRILSAEKGGSAGDSPRGLAASAHEIHSKVSDGLRAAARRREPHPSQAFQLEPAPGESPADRRRRANSVDTGVDRYKRASRPLSTRRFSRHGGRPLQAGLSIAVDSVVDRTKSPRLRQPVGRRHQGMVSPSRLSRARAILPAR